MCFTLVFSDNQSNIYTVTDGGDLLYFRDEARNGTPQWAFGGVGQMIGSDWGHFLHVFSGDDGIIYAVAPNGNLLFFKDEARDGTAQWAFGGIGQKISEGWHVYSTLFSGGDGIIYAVASNGDLLYFRDEARNGTPQWSFGGVGQKIHTGWDKYRHIISGGGGVIYAVDESGDLLYFRDKGRDGTRKWFRKGKGARIGSGFNLFSALFSGGDGIIYAVTPDNSLMFYKDEAQNGKADWANNGIGREIGEGWTLVQTGGIEGYCTPLSVFPGGAIAFKVSSEYRYQVTYERLKDGGMAIGEPFFQNAREQLAPPDSWQNGCGWDTSFTLDVPADWESGLYAAHCRDLNGDEFYIVFVVKPLANQRRDIAVLANTNTWNAYNGYGCRSKYSAPPAALLSFERPNYETIPFGDGPNHLTMSELWILNWLESEGYPVDVYSDKDFHEGIENFENYKALILTTHPEYWTLQMLDNLEQYIEQGGSLLYLGGNGVFEKVQLTDGGDALILLNGDAHNLRAESFLRNLDPPRPERALLGVAYRFDNYSMVSSDFAPYRVVMSGHRFFAGTGLNDGDLIGQDGMNGGAASGWEMDTSEPGNAPDGATVSATGADDRGVAPGNLVLLARGANNSPGGIYGADMTVYETAAGGVIFSAGSLTFGGSLAVDEKLQRIVRNVLDECLQ